MSEQERYHHVSASPTLPTGPGAEPNLVTLAALLDEEGIEVGVESVPALREKARQAYYWIVNNAIISPHYDIAYGQRDDLSVAFREGSVVTLPTEHSFCSYVLLPLLNFIVRKRALLIGGPGKGKTATAILLGILAGYTKEELTRAIRHGQPQMTVTDLLGAPMPGDLIKAETPDQITVAWRRWIQMRVKIVDEYNRIPTRTQSSLLTLMGSGYAEVFDQILVAPPSAWFLTANDDAGGGTFQVIEALKDRIDVVVKALQFNSQFLDELLHRLEGGVEPHEVVPASIIFTPEELDALQRDVMTVTIPPSVLRVIRYFISQFDFCDLVSPIFEYKSKDTARLSGVSISEICNHECPRDKTQHICTQTQQGLSVRSFMTLLTFSKALAWFRGSSEVALEDVRQIVPFILHEKLHPNLRSPFFQISENRVWRMDRVGWIRNLFDLSMQRFESSGRDIDDEVSKVEEGFNKGLDGMEAPEVRKRMRHIHGLIEKMAQRYELDSFLYESVLALKYYYMRYQSYLAWLEAGGQVESLRPEEG